MDDGAIAKKSILRGAEIYGLGIVFRIQEYVSGLPYPPWTDLFRVDILNILGISMMLMGGLCWLTSFGATARGATSHAATGMRQLAIWRGRAVLAALAAAVFVVLVTPLLWTTKRLKWLPWPLESYLNGVHVFGRPQPWLIPDFPLGRFRLRRLGGRLLFANFAKRKELAAFLALGGYRRSCLWH